MSIQEKKQTLNESLNTSLSESNTTKVVTYETPLLVHFGDVRDVTLGPTLGIGESGGGASPPRRNN